MGDLVAIGVFLGAASFIYAFVQFDREGSRRASRSRVNLFEILFPMLAVGLGTLSILGFFSRGSISWFVMAVLVFVSVLLWKLQASRVWLAAGMAGLLVVGYFFSSGSFKSTFQEVQTLENEIKSPTSFSENLHAGKIALAMHREFPVWGVGTDGYLRLYPLIQEKTGLRPDHRMTLAEDYAMNHYLQIWAEEGVGAYLYYLFLILFFAEVISGLLHAASRYQFIIGLAIFSWLVMVHGHATIHPLLENFNMNILVYTFMGACLGILHPKFSHTR
ncbi:MAG: O-antigen ligase family protein [Candidatus Omnitrophota bacterium]